MNEQTPVNSRSKTINDDQGGNEKGANLGTGE
jgi:hypothetical protein